MKKHYQVSTYFVTVSLLSLFSCGGEVSNNVIDNARSLITVASTANTPAVNTHLSYLSIANATFSEFEIIKAHRYFDELNGSVIGIDPRIANDVLLTANKDSSYVINIRLEDILS